VQARVALFNAVQARVALFNATGNGSHGSGNGLHYLMQRVGVQRNAIQSDSVTA
jgi:hypothetical protein